MARPSATAALLLLLVLSLLAVAHCRTASLTADHDTEPESTTAVAVNDEKAATDEEALTLPAEQHHDFEFLHLPSHRIHHHHHHRPCSLHRHLWWKRHHGVYRDVPSRFHDHYSGHDSERREAVSRLAMILPAEEEARETEEVKPVAEPDPDRSLPDSDGEREQVASREEPSSFADADGHDGEHVAAVRAWKKEMLRRWFHFHFHHGLRRHRPHHDEEVSQEQEEGAAPEDMNMKRFHFHHHHDEDEEKDMVRKRLRHAEHDHDEDSDDEDEDVEEMVRRFRKAIMRRRFGHGHGRRFFHHFHHDHSHHRHAEEAEKPQAAGGEEESGVMTWIKGLMNRF